MIWEPWQRVLWFPWFFFFFSVLLQAIILRVVATQSLGTWKSRRHLSKQRSLLVLLWGEFRDNRDKSYGILVENHWLGLTLIVFQLWRNAWEYMYFPAREWGPCALHHWIQSSMEAILACHPAVSTEWLAGWQFPVYYDVCARPPLFNNVLLQQQNSSAPCKCFFIEDYFCCFKWISGEDVC